MRTSVWSEALWIRSVMFTRGQGQEEKAVTGMDSEFKRRFHGRVV